MQVSEAILLASAGGVLSAIGLALQVGRGFGRLTAKLDSHGEGLAEVKADVRELQDSSRKHSTAIAALEAVQ